MSSGVFQGDDGKIYSGSNHVCPKCGVSGRVFHSQARRTYERVVMRLAPRHGVYRCHDCNWRGWKVRSSSSTMTAVMLASIRIVAVVSILVAAAWYLWRLIPSPTPIP